MSLDDELDGYPEEDDDLRESEDDGPCMGAGCINPEHGHRYGECFTVEMHREWERHSKRLARLERRRGIPCPYRAAIQRAARVKRRHGDGRLWQRADARAKQIVMRQRRRDRKWYVSRRAQTEIPF